MPISHNTTESQVPRGENLDLCMHLSWRLSVIGPPRQMLQRKRMSAFRVIVLQKSKVEGQRIFRKNTKRKAIADSYNLYRVTEVAYEFNVRR